jgi:ParB-like chromosome segregation protein Spo0J
MQKPFALNKIRPNPFRNIDRYPIQREKVEVLKESLRRTGFWENIVAREVKGEAQIAFGHHRLIALHEELGPKTKVPLIVKELDDEAMLQMMARENMEQWATSAVVEQETIRATIEAYAEGRVKLPEISKDTKKAVIRCAPSFVQGDDSGDGAKNRYTAVTVAEFLGWPDHKVHSTLSALELIEQQVVKEEQFQGLSTKQAEALTTEVRKAKRSVEETAGEEPTEKGKKRTEARAKKEAARVAEHVSEKLQAGEIGYKEAAKEASKVRSKPANKNTSEADEAVDQLVEYLDGVLSRGDPNLGPLEKLAGSQKQLSDAARKNLRVALDKLADRCLRLHDRL